MLDGKLFAVPRMILPYTPDRYDFSLVRPIQATDNFDSFAIPSFKYCDNKVVIPAEKVCDSSRKLDQLSITIDITLMSLGFGMGCGIRDMVFSNTCFGIFTICLPLR